MPDILVRNVKTETAERLRRRAHAHRRSLQQELTLVLEAAAAGYTLEGLAAAERIRKRVARYSRVQTDSAVLVREGRSK